jgi:probable HAF family extracellular repeat protein
MTTYTFTTLDDPSAIFGTYAYGINGQHQIVGYYVDGSGHKNGFAYSGGSYTTIDNPETSQGSNQQFYSDTVPQGINDAGQIVGYEVVNHSSGYNGFLYSGGTFTDLNRGGGAMQGINNQGEIVGTQQGQLIVGGPNDHIIIYQNGTYQPLLDYPAANATFGHGVNNQNQIVGNWIGTDLNLPNFVMSHGFFYNNGAWEFFDAVGVNGTFAVGGTFAQGINDADQIVGYYVDSNLITHGFVYNQPTGTFTTIDVPNATNTYLYGINDAGEMVGAYVDSTGHTHGFGVNLPPPGLINALSVAQQMELIYIGYFDRSADGGGLNFWEGQNTAAQSQGQDAAVALTNIANSFTPQPETIAIYPFLANPNPNYSDPTVQAGLTTFIENVYGNLFGHAADSGGLAYWTGQIESGAVGLGAAVLAIANGAQGSDATILQNKITVAFDFTTLTEAANVPVTAALIAEAKTVLAGVDGISLNDAAVTAAEALIASWIASHPNGALPAIVGSALPASHTLLG